jgi:CTP:molybdopterin cytidylyltransferase MocA
MFSSIVCAANWPGWRTEISSWAITLGDQPHLNSDTLRQLLAFHSAHAGAICQPEFGGHTRHPVILPRAAFALLKGPRAATLKDFLKQIAVPRVQCAMTDAGLALDMDTPEDYKHLKVSN